MGKIKSWYYKITKQNTMEDKLIRGEVTYDEAMDRAAADFAYGALEYFDTHFYTRNGIKEEIKENIPNTIKVIEDVLNNARPEDRGIDLLYLRTMKEYLPDKIRFIRTDSILNFSCGLASVKGFETYNAFVGKNPEKYEFLDDIVSRCLKPEVMEAAKSKNRVALLGDDFYPTAAQFRYFYECVRVFERAVNRTDSVDNVDCFNEKGLLINEDGQLLERDIFEGYPQIDFKGLV